MPHHDGPELTALRDRLASLLSELRAAVEATAELKARSPACDAAVTELWEEFLRALVEYVRERKRAGRKNPFADLSFHRVWSRPD